MGTQAAIRQGLAPRTGTADPVATLVVDRLPLLMIVVRLLMIVRLKLLLIDPLLTNRPPRPPG